MSPIFNLHVTDEATLKPKHFITFIFQAMNKLSEAQIYFNKNNPQSVELENVVSITYYLYFNLHSFEMLCLYFHCFYVHFFFQNTLYFTGAAKLESELKDQLVKHSKPLLPIILLDLIALEEGK